MQNTVATKTYVMDNDYKYNAEDGLQFERHYTREGVSPFDMFTYELRSSVIREPNGQIVFEMKEVEVPNTWSQVATDILAQKYFRKAGVPQYNADGTPMLNEEGKPVLGSEKSMKQVAHRLAGTWRFWGEKYGYFASPEDAQVFYDELVYMLVAQIVAPNSPQWFSTGLYWAYGINGPAQGHFYVDDTTGEVKLSPDAYSRNQPHACFIQSIKDDLVNPGGIMDLWVREARLFKYGSGTGTNFSNLRGSGEKLSGGGTSSGLMSWLRIGDRAAGAIKSGGTTRRAAKMVILNVDHPDIEKFVDWKVNEEKKVAALIASGYDSAYEGEAYQTVSGQNSNNSVRVSQDFMEAVENDGNWDLKWRINGYVCKTLPAKNLWNKIANAAWSCADPGLQFDTNINDWHTCPKSGRINASNPCCVTGDTLIAVADGRNALPIKDLVGQEVPVYTHDHEKGHTTISRMWNIGVKRNNAPIYRVTLDDGSSFKATDDHLIMLRDGTYKKVRDLQKGESLMPFHSKVLAPAKNRTKRRYYWTGEGWKSQFRAVWNYLRGPAPQEHHIHHADFNALNDTPENLVLLTAAEHNSLHSDRIRGDANSARRLMNENWKKHISEAVRGEKNPNFGHVYSEKSRELMRVAANNRWSKESEHVKTGVSIKAALKKARENGRQIGRRAKLKSEKSCPVCRETFKTIREEQLFCSLTCRFSQLGMEMVGPKTWEKNRGKALSPDHRAKISESVSLASDPDTKRRAALAAHKNQILRAARLLLDNNLSISISNWDECRVLAISLGATRVPSGNIVEKLFTSETELCECASLFNHKVVSVVFEGNEDVYDGTVDKHHNFAILTKNDSSCVKGYDNYSGIFIHNSEYMFLDDTACNLASINLGHYYDVDSLAFDVDGFKYTTKIWTVVLEISILMAQFPSFEIAKNSYLFRSLGLGYANIGSVLMTAGIPYDSPQAMGFAGAITALMTAESYSISAEMSKLLGSFSGYEENKEDMLRVIRNHRRAAYNAPDDEYEDLAVKPMGLNTQYIPAYLLEAAQESWDKALAFGQEFGYRNSQVTLLAPTGTIGLLMDCATTGVEPDFALVKFKKLSGGGYFKIVNESVPVALRVLGYTETQMTEMINYLRGRGTLKGAPHINYDSLKEKGFTDDDFAKMDKAMPMVFELPFAFNTWTLGEDCLTRLGFTSEQYNDQNFNLLIALGFTQEQISAANEYVCGAMTIEGAPHLRKEHYAVFDTANKNGKKGQRYIHYLGHIRMMAAVQPFLSGAISKTINMPNEATIEDVKTAYIASWKLGLKAIALYRDGCKLSQPLSSKSKDKEEKKEEKIEAKPEVKELEKVIAMAAAITEASVKKYTLSTPGEEVINQVVANKHAVMKYAHDGTSQGATIYVHGEQRKLPYKRSGMTIKTKVQGQALFLRTGEYPDGKLGEIFIDMHKEGAAFRSLLNLFAISISIGLQYGVPLEEYVNKFTFTRFEPSGMTDHPNIKFCTSIIDFIFRVLGMEYLGRMDFVQVKPTGIQKNRAEQMEKIEAELRGQKTMQLGDEENSKGASLGQGQASLPNIPKVEPVEPEAVGADQVNQQLSGMMGDAPPCPTCGHITIRSGSCYKCLNCGSTTGCS